MSAAAFFDVDGTLLHGNVVEYYAHLRTFEMTPRQRRLWMAGFVLTVPWWFALDKYSRAQFQRRFYRNYARLSPSELERRAREHFERWMEPRLFPDALRRVREHQERGDRVVLVTGSIRPIVEPLAAHLHADALLAPELQQRHGAFTGELTGDPLAAEGKAAAVSEFVQLHELDIAQCHAYADSADDLPLLRQVGRPVVVNPGATLRRVARREGWEILTWR